MNQESDEPSDAGPPDPMFDPPPFPDLAHTSWRVPVNRSAPTLSFDEDGLSFSVYDGCNGGAGLVRREGAQSRLCLTQSTARLCLGCRVILPYAETRYIAVLDDQLVLLDEEGRYLLWFDPQ